MDIHKIDYKRLSTSTYLLQFYIQLTRGFFSPQEIKNIQNLEKRNVERLLLMRNMISWDGRYDLVTLQQFETDNYISKAKKYLKYNQICDDTVIANYLIQNYEDFFRYGITLKDLKSILDIKALFSEGYMLQDVFNGYPEKEMFRFYIDCIDYLHSAAHFYNEGYDYNRGLKRIKLYSDKDYGPIQPFELRRIPSKDEIMFRNFRESYINIILFIESFINSVGYDAFLAGYGSNEKEKLNLRGIQAIKKNSEPAYSDLTQRIKNFAKIIGNNSIDVGAEPYRSYLNRSIKLRNQYIHSSPDNRKVKYSVEDWKQRCDEMISNDCFFLLNSFWKSCYPKRQFPVVIYNEFHSSSFKGHQGKFLSTQ